MTIAGIIKQVRYCLDEDTVSKDYIDTNMDNIIRSKIGYALRWAALHADASLLLGSTEQGSNPFVSSITAVGGKATLPQNFVKLIRARANNWKKGVSVAVSEDSEEYVMQSDNVAKADERCPIVAFIASIPPKLELFPTPSGTTEITIAVSPNIADYSSSEDTQDIAIPGKLEPSIIYYIAYLVMCAFNDTAKAQLMLGIASQSLSLKYDNK